MILRDIGELFFPRRCPVCEGELAGDGSVICTACAWDMPLTGFWAEADNPVAQKFWGHIPVEQASAFFYYTEKSRFKELVLSFKYRGGWRLAEQLGRWYGARMEEGGLYGGVDVVIGVPLHARRRMSRGYNQSEYLAEGIARALERPVDRRSVRRRVNNPSQTRTDAAERWDNVQGIFAVRRPERLSGKHILLVDDVLTTGATIISCAEAILAAVPDAKISIAALAVSKKGLER